MLTEKECYLCEVGYGFSINNKERGFSRGNYIPYRTINYFIKQRNRYSVFSSAYRYNCKDIDKAVLYGDLYLDFDDADNYDNVKADALTALSYLKIAYQINENQVKIYFSGNKGIHIIVPAKILGVEPMPLLNGVFKTIALSIKSFTPNKTIDTQIYDNKRMFRIPNTVNEKSNLYKIPITSDELRNLSEEEVKVLAQQPRQIQLNIVNETNAMAQKQFKRAVEEYYILDKDSKKDKRHRTTLTCTPPCIQHILENGAPEGQRNITIACLTSFCKNSGKSLNETIDFISEWNSKNVKPTGEREMKTTIKSIFNSDKSYGCSTLSLLTICDKDRCKLYKKKEGIHNVTKSKNN